MNRINLCWLPSAALAGGMATCSAAAAASAEPPQAPHVQEAPAAAYVAENRSLLSGGVARTFVLAHPGAMAPGRALPLVFSLHGDGGNGASMRAQLPLEGQAVSGAVFVYPNAPGGTFEYWTWAGRTREAAFVTDVIAALHSEFGIDTQRVYIAGFSGGATMANLLGCRLGADVIRGLGINAGSLWPEDGPGGVPDFTYTEDGGVSCALPATIFVWGMSDHSDGVDYDTGLAVRDNFRPTLGCQDSTTPWPAAPPCVAYDGCTRQLDWCPIAGMGHAIWSGAAAAEWAFFARDAPDAEPIFANGFDAAPASANEPGADAG